jgi:hypothetical protein
VFRGRNRASWAARWSRRCEVVADVGTRVTHSYEITVLPLRPFRAISGILLPDHRDMRPQMRANLEALRNAFAAR